MPAIRLKQGRQKPLLRRHPWVFSGAIDPDSESQQILEIGETVEVLDWQGNFLARGAYNPHSNIRIRVWTWEVEEMVNEDFFHLRLDRALATRKDILDLEVNDAYRLVYGESDGLPGLVVDRFGDFLAVQFSTGGAECWKGTLTELLLGLTHAKGIFERSDLEVRQLEGLPLRTGLLRGIDPPDLIQINENGIAFYVDIRAGHKTGFYLDQRDNRVYLRPFAQNREVLDCFTYTGGFTLSALMGGASEVTAVESSQVALDLARKNLSLNQLPGGRVEWIEGDVFHVLRKFRDQGRTFDLIVLDPPKFAPTIAQASRAARGYKDINLLALKLLRSDGILFTFSCSGGISEDFFQKIVADAALDAGVEAQIIKRLNQAPDHPVALSFPEGAYLKGLVVRVLR